MPRGIGSTEIAAVAALYLPQLAAELPKTKTATDVWARLLWGLDARTTSRMSRGLNMEPWARDYYEQHIGPWWRPVALSEKWVVRHPLHDWASASPDGYDAPDGRLVIESKTQSEWARKQWGAPGTDEMANRYLYQCQWLMSCCARDIAHVLCVFGHDVPVDGELAATEFAVTEPAIYVVERDREAESMLLDLGARFISEFVRTRVPPPVKPANNRRTIKERINAERGQGAAEAWYRECEERERATAEHGAAQTDAGAETG